MLQAGGGTYDVLLEERTRIQATLRGRLKLEQRTGDRVVAGDRVHVHAHADGSHTIESVDPRTTQLARSAPGRHESQAKVIVANVDQVVLVFAAAFPDPRPGMIDRLLVLAEANHIPAALIINKIDLAGVSDASAPFGAYERAGYPVLYTSVTAGSGIDEVRTLLCGRESVLTGPSGAGKSSLLNAIEPGLDLRVGDVSDAVRKGRHTTVSARLVPLACGGFVVDTPGLREVGLWGVDGHELAACFPEFRPLLGQCRFAASCTHTHEPDCAVRDAVEQDRIDRARYESYVALARG